MDDETKLLTSRQTKYVKDIIKKNIMDSYDELTNKKKSISIEELKEWLINILTIINTKLDQLSENFRKPSPKDKTNEGNGFMEYKKESNSELNIFTSKDIQEENKEITRNFQNETYNHMNTVDQVENENVAKFLLYVAETSRASYNVSLKLLNSMKEKFIEFKQTKVEFEDENIKKEFSAWVKTKEKENQIKEKNKLKEYENILSQDKIIKKEELPEAYEYMLKLYYDLSLMYFHCHLAFPLVKIDFEKEDNFAQEKMIDFINRGKSRKVNFVILPALISSGNFLQNGKAWVFTFTNNTFKYEDTIIETLNALLPKQNLDINNIKDILKIGVIYESSDKGKFAKINTNIDLPEDLDYEFVFYYTDKNDNKSSSINTKNKIVEIKESWENIKWEFKVKGETLFSSKD